MPPKDKYPSPIHAGDFTIRLHRTPNPTFAGRHGHQPLQARPSMLPITPGQVSPQPRLAWANTRLLGLEHQTSSGLLPVPRFTAPEGVKDTFHSDRPRSASKFACIFHEQARVRFQSFSVQLELTSCTKGNQGPLVISFGSGAFHPCLGAQRRGSRQDNPSFGAFSSDFAAGHAGTLPFQQAPVGTSLTFTMNTLGSVARVLPHAKHDSTRRSRRRHPALAS
jgi:hypothetical protein